MSAKSVETAKTRFVGRYYRAASLVIWVMLVSYSLPVFAMIGCAVVTRGFSSQHFILSMFSSLISTADDSYSIFHRVLVPLVAGFSVVAFKNKATSRNAICLLAFILLSILSSIGLNLYMSSGVVGASIKALGDGAFSLDMPLAKTFLNRVQEVLGTLLMMLLGLQLSESVSMKEGE